MFIKEAAERIIKKGIFQSRTAIPLKYPCYHAEKKDGFITCALQGAC